MICSTCLPASISLLLSSRINVIILDLHGIYASEIFGYALAIVADILLMVGAAKERRSFLLPWLVLEVNSRPVDWSKLALNC